MNYLGYVGFDRFLVVARDRAADGTTRATRIGQTICPIKAKHRVNSLRMFIRVWNIIKIWASKTTDFYS